MAFMREIKKSFSSDKNDIYDVFFLHPLKHIKILDIPVKDRSLNFDGIFK